MLVPSLQNKWQRWEVLKQRFVVEAAAVKLHAKDADVRVSGKKVLIDGP